MDSIILLIMIVFVKRTLNYCQCGQGGLCLMYDNDPSKGISAEPCSCDFKSKRIFVSSQFHCNKLVDHCVGQPCSHAVKGCSNGWGTFYCPCTSGWTGQRCDVKEEEGHSKFVWIWYWVTNQKEWELVVSAVLMANETQLIFEFDYGRKLITTINSCERKPHEYFTQKYNSLQKKTPAWYVFSYFSTLSLVQYADVSHYICRIPLAYVAERRVFIQNLLGPVGQYHDVRVKIRDDHVSHVDGFFRVFVHSIDLERRCPFIVEFSGCGKTPGTADYYGLGRRITLSVSVIFTVAKSYCYVKFKTYDWSFSPLILSQDPIPAGEGHIISMIPFDLGIQTGLSVFSVNITFRDAITLVDDESVMAVCFAHFIREPLSVSIKSGHKLIMCDVHLNIVLESDIVGTAFKSSELTYRWFCPEELCAGVKLDSETLQFSTMVPCGKEYSIELVAGHEKSNQHSIDRVRLKFVRQPYNIVVRCEPSCMKVNPSRPLILIATEEPSLGNQFKWSTDAAEAPFDTTCVDVIDPNSTVIVAPNSLSKNAYHIFKVTTEGKNLQGTHMFTVETVQDPIIVSCKVEPKAGFSFIDRFNISFHGMSSNRPVTYWVYEGAEPKLVMITTSRQTRDIEITEGPILVIVSDTAGATTSCVLPVKLADPGFETVLQLLSRVPSRFGHLKSLLHERAYYQMAAEIDSISKFSQFSLPFMWKYHLIEFLAEIQQCEWAVCIIRIANAIYRLTSDQVANNTYGVDNFILKASSTLYTLMTSLDVFASNSPTSSAHDLLPILTSIHDAVRHCMDFVDPVLFHPFLDEDLRQIHFNKVQKGNSYSRSTISKLGLFVTSHIPNPSPPFEFPSRNSSSTMTVFSNTVKYINCILASNRTKSYFEFIWEEVRPFLKPGIDLSVAVVNHDRESYWWYGMSSAKTSETIEVHVYQRKGGKNWTLMEKPLGPINVYLKFAVQNQVGNISGTVRLPRPNSNIDMHADVYRFFAPRGHNALLLAFPEHLVEHINANVSNYEPPMFQQITESPPKRLQKLYYFKWQSRIYVGISAKFNTTDYYFNYSFIQCVLWSEDMWKSEACIYEKTIGDWVVCRCRHASLLNALTSAPETSLLTFVSFQLYTSAAGYMYAVLIFGSILFILTCLFAVALYLDRKKERMMVVFVDDNFPGDDYPYLIAIYTGAHWSAGTAANIAIRLIGDKSISRVHILTSKSRFSRAQDSWFIIFTAHKLGDVDRIELWQDSSALLSSWYCSEVIVWDLNVGSQFKFQVESWVSASTMHSKHVTSIVIQRTDKKKRSKPPFLSSFETFVNQEHHWASVFILHPRCPYTHFERAVILTVSVLVTITASMMFYVGDIGPADKPAVTYATPDFFASLASMAISSLVTFLVSRIFGVAKDKELSNFLIEMRHQHKTPLEWLKTFFLRKVTYLPVMTEDVYLYRKRRRCLCTVLANFTCFSVIVSCIFYMIPKLSHLSRNKSLTWLITFVVALSCEALFLNPLQLLIMAHLVERTSRKTEVNVIIDVNPMEDRRPYQNIQQRLDAAIFFRLQPMYKPPLSNEIKLKVTKDEQTKVYPSFHFVFVVLMFLLLFIIVHYMAIGLTFHKNSLLRQHFSQNLVLNRTGYFGYLRGYLLPALHRIAWYNGKPLRKELTEPANLFNMTRPSRKYRGFCPDYSTKLMGVPRLRQKRVAPHLKLRVPAFFGGKYDQAYGYLTPWNEDSKLYLMNWKTPEEGEIYYKTYEHWSSDDTKTGRLAGPSRMVYSGSGYVVNLHWSLGVSLSSIIDLEFYGWLDNVTRSIFLTFNLYNMNVDKISSVTVITESLPSGVYWTRLEIESTSDNNQHPSETVIFTSVASISVILAVHVVSVLMFSRDSLVKYILQAPGLIDLLMILSTIVFVITYTVRYFWFFMAHDQIEGAARNEFTPLHSFFYHNELCLVSLGTIVLSVAAFAAIKVHQFTGFEAIKRSFASTFSLIITWAVFFLLFAYYTTIAFQLFDVVKGDLLYITFFKEASPHQHSVGSTYDTTLIVSILVYLVIFFFRSIILVHHLGKFEAKERDSSTLALIQSQVNRRRSTTSSTSSNSGFSDSPIF